MNARTCSTIHRPAPAWIAPDVALLDLSATLVTLSVRLWPLQGDVGAAIAHTGAAVALAAVALEFMGAAMALSVCGSLSLCSYQTRDPQNGSSWF